MGVATPTISSDGKPMDPGFEIVAVDVTHEANRIPYAQLRLLDGNVAERQFDISDGAFFEPGKQIEIGIRDEDGRHTSVFTGLIVRHGIEAGLQGTFLNVELKDRAVKLTRPRRSAVFTSMTDADVIGKLLGDAGLPKGSVSHPGPSHEEIVQYRCSDWDFILTRADLNGWLVTVDAGTVSTQEMEVGGAARHRFEFGISEIFDFEMEVDAQFQSSSVQSTAWDPKTQSLSAPNWASRGGLSQGNTGPATLASKIGFAPTLLTDSASLQPDELQAWADGTMARARMAMIRGRLSVPGIGQMRLLDWIELVGVGKRFNGSALVTGIRHRLGSDGWTTDIQFGVSPEPYSTKHQIEEPPAAGLLPGVGGLQIGVVDSFEKDETGEFRLRVAVPALGEGRGPVWARLAVPDAGNRRGYIFRPEVGDEVIVGFLNEDPRQAIVLGSLFGSKNPPPSHMTPIDAGNVHKGMVSRTGITVALVDTEKPSFYIETPGKNKILLDDDKKTIQMTDQHGNAVTMSREGIVIESVKDLKIKAAGNVEIEGRKVDVK